MNHPVESPEKVAIRQWLSKPYPTIYACGCTGPREIERLVAFSSYKVHISKDQSQFAVISAISKFYPDKKAKELKQILEQDQFIFNSRNKLKEFTDCLNSRNIEYVSRNLDSPRTPRCNCGMKWVEEVNDHYYEIQEHRSPDGVTHTAKLLGPVGGPYVE